MNTRISLQLVRPTVSYRESFLGALREFRSEGLPWWMGGDVDVAERDFAAFVETRLSDASRRSESVVPKTHLWAVTEGESLPPLAPRLASLPWPRSASLRSEFVGRIAIHHELNDALRISGGHIGYDTVPSFRGRGVATEMLRQALPHARALGLSEVLLTCDDTNVASIRVIENNGGRLRETKRVEATGAVKRYYWINLQDNGPGAGRA